jgi:serine/threonine-protein kinase RsbW
MNDSDVIRLDLPATHKYLNVLGACLGEMLTRAEGLDDPTALTYAVQLAVHEICANIVEHAYAGQPAGRIGVTVTLAAQPRRLVVDLADTGRSFDPAGVPEPDLTEGQAGGYGLFLVRQLMDDVTYHPQPGGNHWRLAKRW